MSRIVRIHQFGGPEVLQIDEIEDRRPAEGEVLLEVRAFGVTRSHTMFRSGIPMDDQTLPARLGNDCSGIVMGIGAGVEGLKVGDEVSTLPMFSGSRNGVYGETAIVPASAVTTHPDSLSWVEAAALWTPYLTAYGALIHRAKLASEDTIVITAASSSVGIAALQTANSVGATTIATTRTDDKREALLAAGADHVIVTRDTEVSAEIRRITGGSGADYIFDPIGGSQIDALAGALADHGTLFVYGTLCGKEPTPFPLMPAIVRNLTIQGYSLSSVTGDPEQLQRARTFIFDGIASGKLTPTIARTFTLDDVADSHLYLESNQQIGKVVIVP